jgi:hypothetical protein
VQAIKDGQRPDLNGTYPAPLETLLQRGWAASPDDRPTSRTVALVLDLLCALPLERLNEIDVKFLMEIERLAGPLNVPERPFVCNYGECVEWRETLAELQQHEITHIL